MLLLAEYNWAETGAVGAMLLALSGFLAYVVRQLLRNEGPVDRVTSRVVGFIDAVEKQGDRANEGIDKQAVATAEHKGLTELTNRALAHQADAMLAFAQAHSPSAANAVRPHVIAIKDTLKAGAQ